MKLKTAILSVLGRDALKTIVGDLGIDSVDRRSVEDMTAVLSRAHRATVEVLLEYLGETEVKEVCELYGVSSRGRRSALVERLATELKRRRNLKKKRGGKGHPPMESTSVSTTNQEERKAQTKRVAPPAGMMAVTKTELVWPGKYNKNGTLNDVPRVSLPFQVIESVNESRATREAGSSSRQTTLFDLYEGKEGDTFEEGWKNKLVWGDNLLVMQSLAQRFSGRVGLIYIDPPFGTGADFSFVTEIGEEGLTIAKEQSLIEEKAYRDTWGKGLASYLGMMRDRLVWIREMLCSDGSLFLHIDWRVGHYLKVLLDEIFGADSFVQEIIWKHQIMGGAHGKRFPKAHETILWYAKGSNYRLRNQDPLVRVPFSDYVRNTMQKDEEGRWFYTRRRMSRKASAEELATKAHTRTYVDDPDAGTLASDVWDDMPSYQPKPGDNEKYPTQKPNEILERIIAAASDPDDIVADFFCGSGTTCVVAERLGRRWIGCDLGRFAVHTARKRLLNTENCRPFEVLNLGKYERRYWQVATFGEDLDGDGEIALYEYLAFVLKLYGAQPLSGMSYVHGRKGRAMVHVGAVDAPVTIDEVNEALGECLQLNQKELHVLGWEWEMGLSDLMTDEAKKRGVKLMLLTIPREVMEQQAVDKGDIQFFELAYLDVDIKTGKKCSAKVTLKDFVIPNTELVPEEVREKVKKWSDYIDYWAVDWDFQNDTFMQGWVTYRTRKDRTLTLTSDEHTYDQPGKYTIVVKVIDIFGNDTSQAYEVEVR